MKHVWLSDKMGCLHAGTQGSATARQYTLNNNNFFANMCSNFNKI